MKALPTTGFTLELIAYSGPANLYDGFEPDHYTAPVLAVRTAAWHGSRSLASANGNRPATACSSKAFGV